MDKKRKVFMFLFALMLSLLAWSTQTARAQGWCCLCAMDLQKYRLTKYILIMADGSQKYTCSIHCAAIILSKQKVENIKVADYLTGDMINAKKACYLVGSDVKGVMSKVGKLAFAGRTEASEFQEKHGGEVTDFAGALKAAEQDMAEDVKMLKGKVRKMIQLGRVVAEANSCFACHGIDGKGGIENPGSKTGYIPAWNTEEFARHMNSKAELKKMILTGRAGHMNTDPEIKACRDNARLKMPAWKGFIKGKELHSLVNYIWSLRSKKL
ncbi:MAG: nitrous oxide reductase accessory protein NosL [Deltaproteobacteria bacterium]|nr:nitrous oxide reductase accessory protein NosL [Deltaproteobacteria bacterium]